MSRDGVGSNLRAVLCCHGMRQATLCQCPPAEDNGDRDSSFHSTPLDFIVAITDYSSQHQDSSSQDTIYHHRPKVKSKVNVQISSKPPYLFLPVKAKKMLRESSIIP